MMARCEDCIHNNVCKYVNEKVSLGIFVFEILHNCKDYKSADDVVEVKHGAWKYHECVSSHDGAISGYSCSCCSGFVDEEIFDMDKFNKNYCGACGAKMDDTPQKEG